jgi:DNA primase
VDNIIIVKQILGNVLGSSINLVGDETAFYCPFCHHHKQKLQINLKTQKWHCWVCNSGGKKISYLLRKLDVDKSAIKKINEYYGDNTYISEKKDTDTKVFIGLPTEFQSLLLNPIGFNPEHKQAVAYLSRRGISVKEIAKYNIGYCASGIYARRIIIPSYDSDGMLNYFVSRSYYEDTKMKYKNPTISKNIICFDSQINWKLPIILCEGVFDAIAIRRNAIPLLGKFPSKKLVEKIFLEAVKEIYIALDTDAISDALKVAEYFRKQGICVKLIHLKEKDPAEMGYDNFYEKLKNSNPFGSDELLLNKIISI